MGRYSETREESAEILRLVLRKMTEWNLSFTPVHYTVVYEYVSGVNASLKRAMDDLIATGAILDGQVEEVYYRFIVPEEVLPALESRRLLTDETLAILDRMSQSAATTSETTQKARFGILSQHNALKTADVVDTPLLQAVISRLAGETKKLIETSDALDNQLKKSQKEIETLKNELNAAAQASSIDPLTGVINRRGFEMRIKECLKAQESRQGECSVLFIDIDNFKKINDNHGHSVGDRVLLAVAQVLKGKTRGDDIVARLGGEEFVVVLPSTPIDKAHIVAENIRQNVERIALLSAKDNKTIGAVTVSIGIDVHRPGQTWQKTLERADQAMYQSKKDGKNRTTAYFQI
ncbi:MAG: GGDEF domain-containing protein [Leptospirillia bacterium]